MPDDDFMSKPHKAAGVKVHLGPGYRLNKKTGKVEKIPGFGLSTSGKIKQRTSKKTKPVKRTP